jgi:hypothetical protein
MIRRFPVMLGIFTLAAALTNSAALAQDPPHTDAQDRPDAAMSGQMKGMHDMKGMDNMHTMPAKVDAIDHKTGLVDVTSSGMKLKLHFPPPSLANVNTGDTITLHLGFTK